MPDGFRRLLHLLEDSALISLVLTMIILSFSQLVLRNLDVSGMTWSDTALRVNVLWLAMFGALRASRLQGHIAIDLLGHYLPDSARKPMHIMVSLASCMICAMAAYYSYRFVVLEKEDALIAFLGVPVWACEAIIPVALGVIALRFLFGAAHLPKPPHADQS